MAVNFKDINIGIKFGTDGWRAVIADSFTFDNVKKVANAVAQYIINNSLNPHIIIGYDTRFLAKDFAKTCAEELNIHGITTYISETYLPTPVTAFHTVNLPQKISLGIQFTASHNPPKYCGMKLLAPYGAPASEEVTNEISTYLNTTIEANKTLDKNLFLEFSSFEEYSKHLNTLINFEIIKKSNLKIIYDPIFGAGQNFLDRILLEHNINIKTIHNTLDPLFGGYLPEPKEEYLQELKTTVLKEKANVGLGTDGDSDRLGIFNEKGEYFSPNKIATMLTRHLIKNKNLKGSIARTLSTTHLLDLFAQKYSLPLIETKVGFKWLGKAMMENDVLIAAEESGGISTKGHIPDKDAILAACLVVEMMAYEKKPLDEIYSDCLAELGVKCFNDRFDLHLEEKNKHVFLELLQSGHIKTINNIKVKNLITSEGAKYVLEDGSWFFARSSGTEPMTRVYFESFNLEMLEAMKRELKGLLAL